MMDHWLQIGTAESSGLLGPVLVAQTPRDAALDANRWFGLLELPFLFIAVYFAFRTSQALRGGVFGRGMALIAWGLFVMGVGHLHMQIELNFGLDLFGTLFGTTGGLVAWVVALIATWSLSMLGFRNIYNSSRPR